MSIIRDFANDFETTEWTEAINEVENQYGFINSQGLFDTYNTSEKAIVFDKTAHDITLLPQVNRGSHTATTGKDQSFLDSPRPTKLTLRLTYKNYKTMSEQDLAQLQIIEHRIKQMQVKLDMIMEHLNSYNNAN